MEAIERVLGHNGTRGIARGGVLFLFLGEAEMSGQYFPGASSKVAGTNIRLRFFGFQYAIGFVDWEPGVDINLTQAYTVVHEYGHRVSAVMSQRTGVNFQRVMFDKFVWGNQLDKSHYMSIYPYTRMLQNRPDDAPGEYFAETFGRYVWESTESTHAGCYYEQKYWHQSSRGFSSLLDIRDQSGSENLYDYFRDIVILPLSSGAPRADLRPTVCSWK
jgi:hypothetical protein